LSQRSKKFGIWRTSQSLVTSAPTSPSFDGHLRCCDGKAGFAPTRVGGYTSRAGAGVNEFFEDGMVVEDEDAVEHLLTGVLPKGKSRERSQ
jgi:hypothetical protein